MRFRDSIFGRLLEPINRRQFQAVVDRLDADAYDKSFKSWDHLVALIYAQLSGATGLRELVSGFNANTHHHYHLGVGELARSTLGDANARRPTEVFAQIFAMLAEKADRRTRQQGTAMVRLIDASPIPLGKICKWAKWNGRIRGMKMHVVYDPTTDVPHCVEITPANINDVEVGRQVRIEPGGMTYVYDKGYCRFDWWRKTARKPTCACGPHAIGLCASGPATASPSSMTPRCGSSARATPGCRSRCGASG